MLFPGALVGGKVYIFGFIMMRAFIIESFNNFRAKLGHKKVKKLPKMTSLPLFGHTEVALGYFRFEGENEFQMKKLKLFQKLDRKTFPTRYLGLNLVKGKASKVWFEKALHIGSVAPRIG